MTSTPVRPSATGPHSLGDTSKEQLNADLLAFIKG